VETCEELSAMSKAKLQLTLNEALDAVQTTAAGFARKSSVRFPSLRGTARSSRASGEMINFSFNKNGLNLGAN